MSTAKTRQPDALLPIDEAAARLGIKRRTVYDLISRGQLEAIRVGSLLRVEPAAIERFKQRHRVQVQGVAPQPPKPAKVVDHDARRIWGKAADHFVQ